MRTKCAKSCYRSWKWWFASCIRVGFNFFPWVCSTIFWYRNLNIKKHTDIIFGCRNDWPWRILKTRNRNCDFKNLKFWSLTRNEFTERYILATGGCTVVILASGNKRLHQGANSFGVFTRWFKSRRGIIFHFLMVPKIRGNAVKIWNFVNRVRRRAALPPSLSISPSGWVIG
jgi:hypothetical protein